MYNYIDSILEAHKIFSIRNNITSGSRVDLDLKYVQITSQYVHRCTHQK
jgi:hypothetical protein